MRRPRLLTASTVALAILAATGMASAGNLLTNGDFSQGNSAFESNYAYSPGNIQDPGTYCVVSDATQCHSKATRFADHTGANGLMLVANGARGADQAVWRQSVVVTAGVTYLFSGWVTTWSLGTDPSPPRLRLEIDGQQVGGDFEVQAVNGQWTAFGGTWQADSTGLVTLAIYDVNLEFAGNDLALDDLVFSGSPSFNACELFHDDIIEHIPAMRDSKDKILRVGCLLTEFSLNPTNADIQCTAVASTAVSDLANDVMTAFEFVDLVSRGKAQVIKDFLLSLLQGKCERFLDEALASMVDSIKARRPSDRPIAEAAKQVLRRYIGQHVDTQAICGNTVGIANAILAEADDETYSTGHKCVAGTLDVRVLNLNTSPWISLDLFPLHETSVVYPGCPRERTSPVKGVYWGAGGPQTRIVRPPKCSFQDLLH